MPQNPPTRSDILRAIREAPFTRILDAHTIHAVTSELVACSVCQAAHFFVTARRDDDGWIVTCLGCDREGEDARGHEELERIKAETTLTRTNR